MSRTIKNSHPGERVLFSTRPRFSQSVASAYLRLILLFLLIYFFTTIIRYLAAIQAQISALLTIPFVEWSTDVIIIIIILLVLSLIWTYLSWKSTCYILTNKRVMIKRGVISKKNVYMHFNKIQDIQISQGFTQRISSAGDIEIFGGRDRTSLILENIPNPDKFEDLLNQKIESIPKEYESQQPKDLRDERYQ
jgi:membrane protein YdbS with pleckstrin-like domain